MPARFVPPPAAGAHRHSPSIRDILERDAWKNHPSLALRLARRRPPPRRALRWQDRALLVLAIVFMGLILLRAETARADTPWGMTFSGAGQDRVGPALDTRVRIEVTGLLARVEVEQSFLNPSPDWVEAVYRYPLPDGAAVDALRLRVGQRLIEGEIRERAEARRVYQQAAGAGQTAALVEQQRANQFETRLANIGPGERVEVAIGFLATVTLRDGRYGLRLPMTFTPRWEDPEPAAADPRSPTPLLAAPELGVHGGLDLELMLHTQHGFAAVESRYHDVDILPEAGGYRIRMLPGQRPDRDFELNWTPDFGALPRPELLTWDGGDAVYAQLVVTPPLADRLQPQPREVVFVIDTSGSMAGASLEQAVAALGEGLAELRPDDRFNLIEFDSNTDVLFDESVSATTANLEAAAAFLADLVANGGTNMAPALAAALGLPEQPGLLRQVVFITDGAVTNEQGLLLRIAEELGDTRLFTISIGSAPNAWFMRRAAEVGRGTHTHVGDLGEVREQLTALWRHIRLPALSGICVDWGTEAEYYPEVIPDLYAGEPLFLTARLPLLPGAIELCGELNGQPWSLPVRPAAEPGPEVLATLWARRKVAALEDSVVFGADPEQVREEIVALALAHGLLTRHTGLVAVDRTPRRTAGAGLEEAMVPGLLPAGSTLATAGFPSTATGWKAQLWLSLLVLGTASALLALSAAGPARLRRRDGPAPG